jgi:hypothetical protein
MNLEASEGIGIAAIGLAVLETIKIYCDNAPSLRDLRCASPGDFTSRQLILDADMLGLIVVVALGGGGAMLLRRWYPLLLSAMALLLISAYYRSVLRSGNEGMVSSERTS